MKTYKVVPNQVTEGSDYVIEVENHENNQCTHDHFRVDCKIYSNNSFTGMISLSNELNRSQSENNLSFNDYTRILEKVNNL